MQKLGYVRLILLHSIIMDALMRQGVKVC